MITFKKYNERVGAEAASPPLAVVVVVARLEGGGDLVPPASSGSATGLLGQTFIPVCRGRVVGGCEHTKNTEYQRLFSGVGWEAGRREVHQEPPHARTQY